MAGTQTPYSVYQDSTGNVNLFNFTITDTEAPSTLQDQFTAAGVAVPSNIDKIYYRGLAPMPRTGGTEITMNTTLPNIGTPQEIRFTYLTPQAETITGFYLDGTEYKFEGGGTADGISTSQPSSPVAGSTYYDTTNNVIKVYNGTTWVSIGGSPDMSNYLAKDNTTAYTPSGNYNPATKGYVDGLVGNIETLLAAI